MDRKTLKEVYEFVNNCKVGDEFTTLQVDALTHPHFGSAVKLLEERGLTRPSEHAIFLPLLMAASYHEVDEKAFILAESEDGQVKINIPVLRCWGPRGCFGEGKDDTVPPYHFSHFIPWSVWITWRGEVYVGKVDCARVEQRNYPQLLKPFRTNAAEALFVR